MAAKKKVKAKAKAKAKPKATRKPLPRPRRYLQSKAVAAAKAKAKLTGPPLKYTVELCEYLPYMFEQGETVAEVCGEINVARSTYYQWKKDYPDFKAAAEHGSTLCEAWWSKMGRAGSVGKIKNMNAAAWIFNMKNRFGWQDKVEIEDKNKREAVAALIDPDMTPKEAETAYFQILREIV